MSKRARLEYGHVRVYGDKQAGIGVPSAPHGGGETGGHGQHGHGQGHGRGRGRGGVPPGQLVAALATISAGSASASQGRVLRPATIVLAARLAQTTQTVQATTFPVTLPAYQAGNLVLLIVNIYQVRDLNSRTASIPGWTTVTQSSRGPAQFLYVLYRVMDGSEGTSATVTFSATVDVVGCEAATYSGVSMGSPVSGTPVGGGVKNVSNTGFTTTTIVTTAAKQMAIMAAVVQPGPGSITSTPAGATTEWWFPASDADENVEADLLVTDTGTSIAFTLSCDISTTYSWLVMLLNPQLS